MATSTRTATDDIRSYVRRVRRILRRLPPVHSDVWLRLLYLCCTYNCGAVETENHALHACSVIQPLWHLHACTWGVYGVSFEWYTLTQLDTFPTNARARNDKVAVQLLWHLLVGATLHLILAQDNSVYYDNHSIPPPATWAELSILYWMASVRRWLRLQPTDYPLRASALCVHTVLSWQRAYIPLWAKHPICPRFLPISVTR
ncbi:hypothetical protein ACHHYP_16377 [Achlya hypogyna]|uniref:Reverse transcriptase zinc-binding domain-containing protein n=1 Tax=Achlya hypogyna TaxID=1202772 RepID=A0A1V9Y8Q9_ACHHY|nr:hypothetical protein ACHHYP_16377 [Achlya hypogyna]